MPSPQFYDRNINHKTLGKPAKQYQGTSMSILARGIVKFVGSALLALYPAVAVEAGSIGVEPLFLEVRPGQSAAIRARNSSDQVSTVELIVNERMVDENGVQTRVEADNDFILFPPQAALEPSSVQVFRLQSIIPNLTESKSYFVTVKQVPVQLEPTEGGGARLQVVFAFDSAVHVVPNGAKADPQILSVAMDTTIVEVETGEFTTTEDGGQRPVIKQEEVPAVAITLRNDGNKYFYLQNQDFEVTGSTADGSKVDFPSWTTQEVLNAVGVVLVKPGDTRNIKLPLPRGTTAQNLTASVKERQGL